MAAKTEQADRIDPISGIVVRLLDRGRLDAAARALGVVFPPDTSDEKAAVNLYSRYLKEVGGDSGKLLECEFCKGRAPQRIKECPYCPEQASGAKATDPTEAKKIMTTTATTKADPKAATGSKANLAVVQGGKALAAPEPSLVGKTAKDLDRAVQEVFALKTKSAMGMWELGAKIAEIHDQQLWKLRGEDGKPRYKTAEAFVTAELNMSVTHAWNLMDISRKFTAEDVKKFGTSKLGLLLQAPEEARPAIQQRIEQGASKNVVAQEVRKANKGRTTTTTKRGPNAGKVSAKSEKARPAKKLLTIANVLGKQTLPMYAKATMKGDKKDWTRAKKLSEVPTCVMELENDVKQTFTLIEHGDGTIKLIVDTHRDE